MALPSPAPLDTFDQVRAQVHGRLMASLPAVEAPLVDVCRYALGPSGKMLRPLLIIETCRAVGGDPLQVLPAAAGTEFGHLASLVHDDLIDGDELRRGQETIWKRYGRDFAILAGDMLIFHAFLSLAECRETGVAPERIVRALKVMAQSCIHLCLGQDLEASVTRNIHAPLDSYIQVVRYKTSALFQASAEVGAILGGGTDDQVEAMARYGDAMGLAFQIVDDMLCYKGSVAEMGKPVVSDLRNGRITLPVLICYECTAGQDRAFLEALFTDGHAGMDLEVAHRRLVELLHRTGALERSAEVARRYVAVARDSLHTLPPSPSRDALDLVLTLVTERNR